MSAADEEALKRRRQLHRDSMRRHRQRHIQGLQSMRASIDQLTRRFQEVDAAGSPQLVEKYREMVLMSQCMQKEQVKLQGCIVSWEKVTDRLKLILADQRLASATIHTRQLIDQTETGPLQFQELSESSIQQVIRRSSVNLRRDKDLNSSTMLSCQARSAFGWLIGCELSNANDVFVRMTKRLPGVSAHQVLLRSWESTDNPALYPHLPPLTPELVQVVPERAFIEVRKVPTHGLLAGKTLRSCMMRFKVKTERGYAVGMGTVMPEQCPKGGANMEFVEFSTWTELADDIDGSCVAIVSYRGQYNSGDTPHQRFLNLLSTVRRWEDLVMDRPLKLVYG